jgi:hypothetical protein
MNVIKWFTGLSVKTKIVSAVVAGTIVVGSGVGIGVGIANGNKDNNNNNNPTPPPQGPTATQVGTSLITALKGQLEAAKTLNVKITYYQVEEETYWEEDDLGDNPELVQVEDYSEERGTLDIIVAKTEDSVALKVSGVAKIRWDKDEEFEEKKTEIYILDGFSYRLVEDETESYYEKELLEMEEFESTTAMLSMILDGVEITAQEELSVIESLGALVGETFTLANNTATLKYDLKKSMNDLATYFGEIDYETKTVESLIDDAFKLVDEELTAEKLLTKLTEFADKTVDEAIVAIDAWLTENYETTLQGIIDTVTDDPRFATILANYGESMEATEEQINEMLTQIKAFDLKTTIAAQEGLGQQKVYDLIMMFASQNLEPNVDTDDDGEPDEFQAPTMEELVASINMVLDTPIGQMLPTSFFESISGTSVNALDFTTSFTYDSNYKVNKITNEQNLDVVNTIASYYDEAKSDVMSTKNSYVIEIGLSDAVTTLALPEDADVRMDYSRQLEKKFRDDNFVPGDRLLPFDYISFYEDGTGWIYFNRDDYTYTQLLPIKALWGAEFAVTVNEDGTVLTCTIFYVVGILPGGYGGSDDPEDIAEIFGDDLTFTITYDETTDTWTTDFPEYWPTAQNS